MKIILTRNVLPSKVETFSSRSSNYFSPFIFRGGNFTPDDYQRWYWLRFPHASMPYADAIAGEFGGSYYPDTSYWKQLLASGLNEKEASANTDRNEQPLNASMENLFREIYGRPMSAIEKTKLTSIPGIDFSDQRSKDTIKMMIEAGLWAVPGTGPLVTGAGKLATKGAMKVAPYVGSMMSKAGSAFAKTGKVGSFVSDNVGDQFLGIGIEEGIEYALKENAAYRAFRDNPNISQQVKNLITQRAQSRYNSEDSTSYEKSASNLGGAIPSDRSAFDYLLGNPSVNYRKYDMRVLSDEGDKFYRDYILSNKNELESNYIPGESVEEFYTRTTGKRHIPKGGQLRPKHGIPMTPGSLVLPELERIPAEKGFHEYYLPSMKRFEKIKDLYSKLPESDRKVIENRIKSGYTLFNPASSQRGFYSTGELMTRDFGESGELELNDDGSIYLNGKKIDLSKLSEQQLQTLKFHIHDNGSNIGRESNKRAYERETGNLRKREQQNIPQHKITMDNAYSYRPVESDDWKKGFSDWSFRNNQHLKNIQNELDNRFPITYENVRVLGDESNKADEGLNPSKKESGHLKDLAEKGDELLKHASYIEDETQQSAEKK